MATANNNAAADSGPERPRRRRLVPAALLLALGAGGLLAGTLAFREESAPPIADSAADRWQQEYWRAPIPPQGEVPEAVLPQARGITPEACAVCHAIQYADWRQSWHAGAMGPGIMGQFPSMRVADQAECQTCHAPMSEQWPQLPGPGGQWEDNPTFDPALRAQGLTCAACHLRAHRRHGPPLPAGKPSVSHVVHGEPTRTPHFRTSEFCKGCHQHPPSAMIINGKAVENTYREWLASPFAAQGVTCQQCHMAGGRHLWNGIHDPELTRGGITITVEMAGEMVEALAPGQAFSATLTLRNSGTGHAFPTYTTPAVFLRAALLDREGRPLAGRFTAERVVQRRLDMSTNPWSEQFDTRVLPGDAAVLEFSRRVPPGAAALRLWVWVEPDHFYTEFYRAHLEGGAEFPGAADLREALARTLESPYLLFSRTIPVRR